MWHSQTPAWFFQHADGTPLTDSADDQALLLARMTTHIETVADHFRTKYGEYGTAGNPIVGFDVVNEAIAESESDGLRRSEWYRTLGPDYIKDAFEIASQAFNDGDVDGPVKLFINDYNTELPAKRQAMFDVVHGLLEAGVPIDGVGHQFHVSLAQPVDQMRTTLEKFATLGLLQDVSELDVQIDGTVTQEKLVAQGYYFADVFSMLRDFPDLFSVTVWGPYDSRSWRTGAPLVFDDDLQAKPAYWGIVDPSTAADPDPDGQRPQADLRTRALAAAAGRRDHRGRDRVPGALVRRPPDRPRARRRRDGRRRRLGDALRLGRPRGRVTRGSGHVDGRRLRRRGDAAPRRRRARSAPRCRSTSGSPTAAASTTSWNDLSNHQETGGRARRDHARRAVGVRLRAPRGDGPDDRRRRRRRVGRRARRADRRAGRGLAGGATAKVRLLWHDDSIDVLAEVTDPRSTRPSTNAWEQDSVEIFLDPANAKSGAYNPADGQYRINYLGARVGQRRPLRDRRPADERERRSSTAGTSSRPRSRSATP